MKELLLKIGRELGRLGLVSSHSGNLSIRTKEGLLITRHKAMLASLSEEDLVEAPLFGRVEGASSELEVHQSIYLYTEAKAVLHCHPPYAVLLSLYLDEIKPVDAEGKHILKSVPVLEFKESVASKEVAQALPHFFKTGKVVLIRGHGSFAIGEDLEEALMYTSSLESSAKILYLALLLQAIVEKTPKGGVL
jgi:L-fuculose-phosphate aldolase